MSSSTTLEHGCVAQKPEQTLRHSSSSLAGPSWAALERAGWALRIITLSVTMVMCLGPQLVALAAAAMLHQHACRTPPVTPCPMAPRQVATVTAAQGHEPAYAPLKQPPRSPRAPRASNSSLSNNTSQGSAAARGTSSSPSFHAGEASTHPPSGEPQQHWGS